MDGDTRARRHAVRIVGRFRAPSLTVPGNLSTRRRAESGAIQTDVTRLNSLFDDSCLRTDANDIVACMERSAMRVGGRGAKNPGFRCAPSRLRYLHISLNRTRRDPIFAGDVDTTKLGPGVRRGECIAGFCRSQLHRAPFGAVFETETAGEARQYWSLSKQQMIQLSLPCPIETN